MFFIKQQELYKMNSLSTTIILQHLSYDKQLELYNALTEKFSKNNSLQNVYTVEKLDSAPTGGDWCEHESTLMITGKYSEAKELFDKKTKVNVLIEDDYGPYKEIYYLYNGTKCLEQVFYDFTDLTVTRKTEVVEDLVDYPINYPLYQVVLEFGYDYLTKLGLYDKLDLAIIDYSNYITKTLIQNDDSDTHYGFKIYIQKIDEGNNSIVIIQTNFPGENNYHSIKN